MIMWKKKPKKTSPILEALRQRREEEYEASKDGRLRTLTPDKKSITPKELKKAEDRLKKKNG